MARALATAAASRLLRGLTSEGFATCEAAACALAQSSSIHYAATRAGTAALRSSSAPSTSYAVPLGATAFAHGALRHPATGSVRTMFVQTQPTPNPNSLMFVPGKSVMEGGGTHEFSNAREGMKSPLAKKLFTVDGVASVFFGSDFITVSKKDDYNWAVLKPDIFAAIMDFYTSGEALFQDADALARSDTAIHPDDSEVVAMIKELLETRVRPTVQDDGGDIVFKGFDEDTGVVMVKLVGACSSCPSSTVTLKGGIENMLMHYIPEVKGVIEAPPDEGQEEGLKAFAQLEASIGESSEASSSGSSGSSSSKAASA